MKCKNCEHWKSKQRELDYNSKYGFCDQNLEYGADGFEENYDGDTKFKLYLHNSFEKLDHTHLDSSGCFKQYNSELVTHREFGCIHFEERK